MLKNTLSAWLLLLAVTSMAQTIPAERMVDWKQVIEYQYFAAPENSIDFKSVGGVGDGITSNASILQNLLEEQNGAPIIINFPTGQYFFDQPINLPAHTWLRGVSADSVQLIFELNEVDHLIKVEGVETTTVSYLIADVEKESVELKVENPSLFEVGDVVKVIENDEDLVTSEWALYSTGQIVEIAGKTAEHLLLSSPLRRDFWVNREAKIVRLEMVENVGIENLKIVRWDETAEQTSNIRLDYVRSAQINCVESQNCNFAHVDIRNSKNIEISGSYFYDAFDYGNGGKGYGVMLEFNTSECLVTNNIFNHLRHAMILQAGANGNIFSYNYSRDPYWADVSLPANSAGDLVLHGNYPYANLFEGNVVQNIVIDDSHGSNGKFNTFFRNRAELYGVFMNEGVPTNSQNFIGNEVTNSGLFLGLYLLHGTDHFEYANNRQGAILPGGTEDLTDLSLYRTTAPNFYLNENSWPPIGVPNDLALFRNQAEARFLEDRYTECADPSLVIVSTKKPIANETALKLVPNPTSDRVQLLFPNNMDAQSLKIKLFSLSGNLLRVYAHTTTISLQEFPAGLYLVELQGMGKESRFYKVVKQ